jgi:hypothetical protein
VIERFVSLAGRLDEDPKVVLVVVLPDILVERRRTKKSVEPSVVALVDAGDGSLFDPPLVRPRRAKVAAAFVGGALGTGGGLLHGGTNR